MNSTEDLSRTVDSKDAFIKSFIVVSFGIIINYINGSFVFIFSRSPVFYMESRYILYIHLVINDMIMLSISVTLNIMIYAVPLVNVSTCCVLLLVGSMTHKNTPLSLAGMAVERYIAICKPLRHSQICTVRRTYMLIILIWTVTFIPELADIVILFLTRPLTIFTSRMLCYPLAIYNTSYHLEKAVAVNVLFLSFVWITLIYTYFRVFFAAKTATTDPVSAKKAQNTILLHGVQLLFCMMSYISPLLEVILLPNDRSKILFSNYLITNILPRFLTPFIYGIRDQKFVSYFKMYFSVCTGKDNKVGDVSLPMLK
ncbi:odorant receptor 131-2-like [Scleropages formosus]|uniref:odorant receptor 131-2-like n=1 Tax=Scleropages formosus TaxID=113540 RepID=UPI0010FAB293|nr:odorant receptor 131-2-like [Scleropages formosus]